MLQRNFNLLYLVNSQWPLIVSCTKWYWKYLCKPHLNKGYLSQWDTFMY